jgi:outer membrane receptor protein involved in Fe transport
MNEAIRTNTRTAGAGKWLVLLCLVAAVLAAPQAWAQNPTGTLTGAVADESGAGLPGVTVTATSPKLQGTRTTQTSGNGGYKLAFLPPGVYQVTYELEGFKTAVKEVKLSAAQTSVADIAMELGVVTEEIVVVGQQGSISETGTGATTLTSSEIDKLPISRAPINAVNLAPGVADTGFGSSNSPSISGAATFENLFMINGVSINENVRGGALNLFIEDAIQETTTSTSSVSAEYGRFTGGVVNAITKSGGNQWEGSFRTSFTNDNWEARTPLTGTVENTVNKVYEGTLGGFLWKDHLWVFGAGRNRETSGSDTTSTTGFSFPTGVTEDRVEAKLTASPHPSHSLIGSYIDIKQTSQGTVFGTVLDLRSVNAQRQDPQQIKSGNYTGILTSNFFVEAQYSERDFVIGKGSGGVPDLIEGTLIRTRGQSFRYWAPTFCGSCEGETRNNKEALVKGSYFLSTEGIGTHDLTFGYDTFDDKRFSINHQTGSDFTVYGSDIVGGPSNPAIDPTTGSPYPVFDPNASSEPWILWFAVFNQDLARPTAFKTNSYYVNDRWQLNDKWSFNLGVRYDENDGANSAGAKVASDSKISPRLGATYDLHADGDWVFNASYGTYVAALANSVADGSSNGGAIGYYYWNYAGPPLNVGCTPGVNCLSADDVLRQVFAWYESQGGVYNLSEITDTAPINNYLLGLDIPGATTVVRGSIKSPAADEYTLGATKRLGTKGLIRADLVYKDWTDFYGTKTDLTTGKTPTSSGLADVGVLGNFAPGIKRTYKGIHTAFRYRINDRLNVAVNYTLSQTEGNFNGETGPSGPISAGTAQYPEYKQLSWNSPVGDLRVDARHKLHAWAIYDILNTEHNKLSVSWLENYTSGQPYGASRAINSRNFVTNPGYATPPSSVTYNWTAPDAFHTDNIHRSDVSLNYSYVFNAWGRKIELFLQPEVLNVFKEEGVFDPVGLDGLEGTSQLATFNPFTQTPVEGTHWSKNSNFGQPVNELDYQTPRTFRFSVGFRF